MSELLAIGWQGGVRAAAGIGGSWVIGVAGQAGREPARRAIRSAVLDELAAWSGVETGGISLHGAAGEAPYAVLDGTGEEGCRLGLSISHEEPFSLAALRPRGAVGVDIMRIVPLPDSLALARDYLGPEAAAALAALPRAEQPAAFARAWCAHEACLKCLGIGLTEWTRDIGRRVASCLRQPIAAPPGHAACLAVPGRAYLTR